MTHELNNGKHKVLRKYFIIYNKHFHHKDIEPWVGESKSYSEHSALKTDCESKLKPRLHLTM